MTQHHQTEVVIIGAGLAGLLAARQLRAAGIKAVILEQRDRLGGRLATRQIGPGLADHGAQFFTVREAAFRERVATWRDAGLVFEWARGWSDGSLDTAPPDGHPRYAVRGGMHALARHLAEGLDVRLRATLTAIAQQGAGWLVQDDRDQRYSTRALLLTPPVPAILPLLHAAGIPRAEADNTALNMIHFAPCLAGIFWIDGAVQLPEPGALQQPDAAITWIADNQRKGLSPDATLITVHAGTATSDSLWSQSDAEVLAVLESALRQHTAEDAHIVQQDLIRWRYAQPLALYPARYLQLADLPPLIFAGDAFGGPRVEGAALSGIAAGKALIAALDAL